MNLLIVAATEAEIMPLDLHFQSTPLPRHVQLTKLVTGIGMPATTYALTRHLQTHSYDLVIQAGIAGSFDAKLYLGEVVFITSDQYGDMGAEDNENYIDIFEMGLLDKNIHPHAEGRLVNPLSPVHDKISLPRVSGLTVNTVSGNEHTIRRRAELFHCATESMEGAAFHYVCLQEGVPFAQIRAISNYVTPRDKSKWKIKEAIIDLNHWLIDFINRL